MKHVDVVRPVEVTLPSHGVAVIESRHADQFEPAAMTHAFSKFVYVLEGRGLLRADKDYPLRAGVLVHVAAGVEHAIEDRERPLALYAACYDPARYDAELIARLAGVRHWALNDEPPHLGQAFRRDLRDLLLEQRAADLGWQTRQIGRMGDMIVRAARLLARSTPDRAPAAGDGHERVRGYLDQPGHRLLTDTLDRAAAACGLSRRRFTDVFRAVAGTSFHQYLRDRRLQAARQLLTDADLSVAAVAFEAGFDDLSHFHRAFRQATGQTPGAYRANGRRSGTQA